MLQVNGQLTPGFLQPVLVMLAALVMIAPACAVTPSLQVVEHSIIVREFTGDITQSAATVKGVAINTGAWAITGCQIEVTYYDYIHNKIGTTTVSCDKLEAGEKWNFQTELKGANAWKVANYDITTSYK